MHNCCLLVIVFEYDSFACTMHYFLRGFVVLCLEPYNFLLFHVFVCLVLFRICVVPYKMMDFNA